MTETETMHRAWEIHRANGHPIGYDGPCWGPTQDEIAQARRVLADWTPTPTDGR